MAERTILFTRGDIARATGVSATTVVNWEYRGLLTPVAVTAGGIKLYSPAAVQQLESRSK